MTTKTAIFQDIGFSKFKTTYTIMKFFDKYLYDVGFMWRKLFLEHLDIDFDFLKKNIFLGSKSLSEFLDFSKMVEECLWKKILDTIFETYDDNILKISSKHRPSSHNFYLLHQNFLALILSLINSYTCMFSNISIMRF